MTSILNRILSQNKLGGSRGDGPYPYIKFPEARRGEVLKLRFTWGLSPFPDRSAFDEVAESISPGELQEQMEGVLKPVLELLKGGNSREDILSQLSEAYPDMDDKGFQEMLSRAIFVSELWGD
jgi:hypothetical protein